MSDTDLSPEATEVANRIRTIDRELDALEFATKDSMIRGLHNSGGAMSANLAQASADGRHADLLAERANLADRLRTLVDGTSRPSDGPSVS